MKTIKAAITKLYGLISYPFTALELAASIDEEQVAVVVAGDQRSTALAHSNEAGVLFGTPIAVIADLIVGDMLTTVLLTTAVHGAVVTIVTFVVNTEITISSHTGVIGGT